MRLGLIINCELELDSSVRRDGGVRDGRVGKGVYNAVGAVTRIEMRRFIKEKAAFLASRYKKCYYEGQKRSEYNKRR